jgi:hypothetical protein
MKMSEALDLTPPVKAEKVKKEKAPKAEKAPKEPKAPSNRKKLGATYPEDAKLEVIVDANPKKVGSRAHAIFEFYRTSATVGDFFAATAGFLDKNGKKAPGTYADITYDVGHGFIKVG